MREKVGTPPIHGARSYNPTPTPLLFHAKHRHTPKKKGGRVVSCRLCFYFILYSHIIYISYANMWLFSLLLSCSFFFFAFCCAWHVIRRDLTNDLPFKTMRRREGPSHNNSQYAIYGAECLFFKTIISITTIYV